MANKQVIIILENQGEDQGPFFDLYHTRVSDATRVRTNIQLTALEVGITASVPDYATKYIVKSLGVCDTENIFDTMAPEELPDDDPFNPTSSINCPCTASLFDDCIEYDIINPDFSDQFHFEYTECSTGNTLSSSLLPDSDRSFCSSKPIRRTGGTYSAIITPIGICEDGSLASPTGELYFRAKKCGESERIIVRSLAPLRVGQVVTLLNSPCCYEIIEPATNQPGYPVADVFSDCLECCGTGSAEIPRDIPLTPNFNEHEVGMDRNDGQEAYEQWELGNRTVVFSTETFLADAYQQRKNIYSDGLGRNLAPLGWYYTGIGVSGTFYAYFWTGYGWAGQQPVSDFI
jgi:hypothetical protein